MAEFFFDPKHSIIICHGEVIGPKLELSVKMALDTGATYTIIPIEAAVAVGCDPSRSKKRIEITTGSGVEYVPLIIIPQFRAFGMRVKNLEVICHNLPTQSPIEGLLGLNFLNKSKLIIDFSRHIIKVP